MGKKEPARYTIEREFLSRISMEEMVIRIIRSYLKNEKEKGK